MEEFEKEIPKKLAACLRAQYRKLSDKRESLASYERTLNVELKRVSEFNRDPQEFSSKYYGRHGPDSNPVKTTISASMQRISYANDRIAEIQAELEVLEREIPLLENEVREAVNSIRKTARCLVPWPDRPASIEEVRNRLRQEIEASEAEYQEAVSRDEAWIDEDDRIIEEMKRKEEEDSSRVLAEYRAMLSPEERAREDALNQGVLKAMMSGEISVDQVMGWAKKFVQK